ncbi:TetR family transcriptional regulator [Lapillicoccus sp.]|uniref:TetR family transcriptional regulator n=1 Tax=Lapillicoccus sp. TaxID=1909287 RepID=UPI0025FC6B5B|nr:TetR family transcriptional regulator [Lapillicoccus sp.]
MVQDSPATRARILAAAVEEFSAHGLAGARIDRIAEAAVANKSSIYVYFGNKEKLFAAAMDRVIGDLSDAVPLTEHDLPNYAGRMFDYVVDHPEALRMSMWRHLERPSAGPVVTELYERKLEAMASEAHPSGLPPMDLLVLVVGLSGAWLTSSRDLLAAEGGDPYSAERLATHRAAMVEAARRVVDGV